MTATTRSTKLVGILMAAGSGSRFGGGKLVHSLPGTDEAIALRSWRNLTTAMHSVCVVVRAGDTATLTLFQEHNARIVVCDDAELGMGHSLACAIRANVYAQGWIIALADMPFIRPESIRAIGDAIALQQASIAIPTYRGRRGHPVGFHAAHGNALMGLSGDAGAKAIVSEHADSVREVDVDDAGILADIDKREDLEAAPSGTR